MHQYDGLLNYELAYNALEHLTVSRVVHYMQYTLCGEDHEVYYEGTHWQQTTPLRLANDPHLAGRLASCIKIYFWGGPPSDEDWFEGTLLTMLLDRLWYAAVIGRNDIVDNFLETLNGGHNQTRQVVRENTAYAEIA
jgi:hypothetical protein